MVFSLKVPEQQQTALLPGANSPQQNAIMKTDMMNNRQVELNKATQGGKRQKRGGDGKMLEVQPVNTSSYNVNGVLKNVATSDIKSQNNSQFDAGAFKVGGSKRRRKSRKSRKSRKRRKSSRRRTRNKKTRRNRH